MKYNFKQIPIFIIANVVLSVNNSNMKKDKDKANEQIKINKKYAIYQSESSVTNPYQNKIFTSTTMPLVKPVEQNDAEIVDKLPEYDMPVKPSNFEKADEMKTFKTYQDGRMNLNQVCVTQIIHTCVQSPQCTQCKTLKTCQNISKSCS